MHKEQERMYTKKDGTFQKNHHEDCAHDYKEIDSNLKHKICITCGKISLECNHRWGYQDHVWGCFECGKVSESSMSHRY